MEGRNSERTRRPVVGIVIPPDESGFYPNVSGLLADESGLRPDRIKKNAAHAASAMINCWNSF